ncbi:hypothetical protein O988_08567 [Pseudogymnoascus sp. VKM F-3808]|nr:hypothetical protein O988_08567 [Pseudogymnoascus sp. VKM F-3808]
MKSQLNALALLALVLLRAAMALPTEVINEDTAADTPSQKKTQKIPVETDNIDEFAGANIKDFGKYGPDYREYGNYRSYRRDENPETTETHIETDDVDLAAVTSYKDYGEYGNYGSYPPHYTKYGTYGTYRRDANPEITQDTQIETGDADGAAIAADTKYANHGKYPLQDTQTTANIPLLDTDSTGHMANIHPGGVVLRSLRLNWPFLQIMVGRP